MFCPSVNISPRAHYLHHSYCAPNIVSVLTILTAHATHLESPELQLCATSAAQQLHSFMEAITVKT